MPKQYDVLASNKQMIPVISSSIAADARETIRICLFPNDMHSGSLLDHTVPPN